MKKNLILLLSASVLVLSSCSKKMQPFAADYFTVNPNPLEATGDLVPATVTASIPAKFFQKNAEVTVTPYLVYGSKETPGTPLTLQGEKVRGNNTVVPYEYGSTATMPVAYKYSPEMLSSQLVLAFDVKQGSKEYALPRVKVANGVIATSTLCDVASVTPAIGHDKFQRIIKDKVSADIKFLINQTNIRKSELGSDELTALHQTLKEAQTNEKLEVEEINISSYASPEGGVKLNTRIASGREQNTKEYLNKELKKNNVTEFGALTSDFTAQDWEGFQQLVSQSNIQDKDLILSVLAMYKDPEQREREIRNLSSVFDQLAKDVLPQLRYSRLTASVNIIGKSDAEIEQAYNSNPKSLTVDELLYCATLSDDPKQQAKVYDTCTEIYPEDYRGWNNLGMCQYKLGDFQAAAKNFDKAAKINPASPEAQMNQGIIALLDDKYSVAKQKLGNAAGLEELNDALGAYYVKTGDYNAANAAFGKTVCNNAALAKILAKDYSGAKQVLANIAKPNATTYYLMAVLGARTNNQQMVTSNLRQAVKLDSTLADRAKNDLEFANINLSSVL